MKKVPIFLCLLGLGILAGCQGKAPVTPPPATTPGAYSSAPITVIYGGPYFNIRGIAYDSGQLWITSGIGTGSVCGLFELSTSGVTATAVTVFNSGTTFAATNAVNAGPDGSLYVTDNPPGGSGTNLGRVYVFDSTGTYQSMISIGGTLSNAVVNSAGTTLFVLSYLPQAVYSYAISGTGPSKTFTAAATFTLPASGNGYVEYPFILAVDSSNNLYISNSGVGYAVEFNSAGNYLRYIGTTPVQTWGLVLDNAGNLFVANTATNGYIQEFNSAGNPVTSFGQEVLNQPEQITLDSSENLFVANYGLGQIIEFKK
jgi:hypothetical protein